MSSIADRLKQARKDAGLTQPALAALAGVSQGSIGNVEAGIRKRPKELLSIATALRVSPLWLETGRGPKDANIYDVLPAASPSVAQSLGVFLDVLQRTDDLTRTQVCALLNRLAAAPERAPEIIPRISTLFEQEHALA